MDDEWDEKFRMCNKERKGKEKIKKIKEKKKRILCFLKDFEKHAFFVINHRLLRCQGKMKARGFLYSTDR